MNHTHELNRLMIQINSVETEAFFTQIITCFLKIRNGLKIVAQKLSGTIFSPSVRIISMRLFLFTES